MGCCLATLITELPAWAAQANKSTSAFLTTKIEKEECHDDDDHTTTGQAAVRFVRYDDEDCAPMTAITTATATRPFAKQRRTKHAAAASSKECMTPTAIVN